MREFVTSHADYLFRRRVRALSVPRGECRNTWSTSGDAFHLISRRVCMALMIFYGGSFSPTIVELQSTSVAMARNTDILLVHVYAYALAVMCNFSLSDGRQFRRKRYDAHCREITKLQNRKLSRSPLLFRSLPGIFSFLFLSRIFILLSGYRILPVVRPSLP